MIAERPTTLQDKLDSYAREWELPTWLLAIVIYGAWLTLTYYHGVIPWYVLAPLGTLIIAWHGSLQHEACHGHPISFKVADIIGTPPLSLITPFPLYRKYHLVHHANHHLTDPHRDPEAYYWRKEDWQALPVMARGLLLVNQTFVGRMLLGPAISSFRFFKAELTRMVRGNWSHLGIWFRHGTYVALTLYWVVAICDMPFWQYALFFVYPGLSMGMIRSFYEHRYDASADARSVIVENSPFFQWLFLNNNFHVVHHDLPRMPWYEIDEHYKANRLEYRALNRHFVVPSYGGLMLEYMFKPIFHPIHPLDDQTLHTQLAEGDEATLEVVLEDVDHH